MLSVIVAYIFSIGCGVKLAIPTDAIGISAVACLNAFGNHRQRHLALKSGITIRAATVNILYEHVLRLSPKGKVGLTSGEITNLFATGKLYVYNIMQCD